MLGTCFVMFLSVCVVAYGGVVFVIALNHRWVIECLMGVGLGFVGVMMGYLSVAYLLEVVLVK